ncbi:dihydroxyacetone kinase subunit DhaL [Flaviflagellibacter deserti]|uniref:Dihydroxyacetone kinase subunit DhaL n=1 Tax=Flaviflagellibacter deserti TaxID=2267266 RepID=A0ABV9Z0J9_9HYPH
MTGTEQVGRAVDAVARCWIDHADELTKLDSAIGDGDHGTNMKRGAEAVLAERDAIVARPLPSALQDIGHVLVESIGGAAGPLYGSFFLSLGRTVSLHPNRDDWNMGLRDAVSAVARRGNASPGEKTMLDVLVSAESAFSHGLDAAGIEAAASEAAESTIPMLARRGRAAFLSERSIGHMDPGALSSALAVAAICRVWEDAP